MRRIEPLPRPVSARLDRPNAEETRTASNGSDATGLRPTLESSSGALRDHSRTVGRCPAPDGRARFRSEVPGIGPPYSGYQIGEPCTVPSRGRSHVTAAAAAPTDDALSLTGIRAIPTELAPARASLTSYMHGLGLPAVQAQDAVLAGYEAMANSVEHAYPPGGAGTFDLHATRGHDGVVTVTITDHGTWKDTGTQPHAKRGARPAVDEGVQRPRGGAPWPRRDARPVAVEPSRRRVTARLRMSPNGEFSAGRGDGPPAPRSRRSAGRQR